MLNSKNIKINLSIFNDLVFLSINYRSIHDLVNFIKYLLENDIRFMIFINGSYEEFNNFKIHVLISKYVDKNDIIISLIKPSENFKKELIDFLNDE